MSTEPRFVTCYCHHCGGGIEFDGRDFAKNETRAVECPHCNKETPVFVPEETVPSAISEHDFHLHQISDVEREEKQSTKPKDDSGRIDKVKLQVSIDSAKIAVAQGQEGAFKNRAAISLKKDAAQIAVAEPAPKTLWKRKRLTLNRLPIQNGIKPRSGAASSADDAAPERS